MELMNSNVENVVLNSSGDNGEMLSKLAQERELYKKEVDELKKQMNNMVEMDLAFQQYIVAPPVNKAQLYGQACANDAITVKSWVDVWLKNIRENVEYDFHRNSVMSEAHSQAKKPVIIAGSGPSLKKNAHFLKDRKDICLVSCLHNFAFFEDIGVKPDYYLNLDAGDITIEELSQGGTKSAEYYWEQTKNHTLLSAIHCNPKLHEMWGGKLLWYSTVIPDAKAMTEVQQITNDFSVFFQCGGNALGACLYMARAILGGGVIGFVGADFCFSYLKKFHPFDSPYDQKFAGVMPCTDIFGNRVYTWQSYYNFKNWFEFIAMGGEGNNPQLFINCTEGGILGAYPEGNIQQIQQMSLDNFIKLFGMHKALDECVQKRWLLF